MTTNVILTQTQTVGQSQSESIGTTKSVTLRSWQYATRSDIRFRKP